MKRWVLIISLVLLVMPVFPAFAQEGDPGGCEIKLSTVYQALTEAAGSLEAGDNAAALTAVEAAHTRLGEILDRCQNVVGITPDPRLGNNINIRRLPTTTSEVVGSLPPDGQATADWRAECTDGVWLYITYNEIKGWVAGDFMQPVSGTPESLSGYPGACDGAPPPDDGVPPRDTSDDNNVDPPDDGGTESSEPIEMMFVAEGAQATCQEGYVRSCIQIESVIINGQTISPGESLTFSAEIALHIDAINYSLSDTDLAIISTEHQGLSYAYAAALPIINNSVHDPLAQYTPRDDAIKPALGAGVGSLSVAGGPAWTIDTSWNRINVNVYHETPPDSASEEAIGEFYLHIQQENSD